MVLLNLILRTRTRSTAAVTNASHHAVQIQDNLRHSHFIQNVIILGCPNSLVCIVQSGEVEEVLARNLHALALLVCQSQPTGVGPFAHRLCTYVVFAHVCNGRLIASHKGTILTVLIVLDRSTTVPSQLLKVLIEEGLQAQTRLVEVSVCREGGIHVDRSVCINHIRHGVTHGRIFRLGTRSGKEATSALTMRQRGFELGRYFGGVLLGTGGLVRAYQAATQAGLVASKIIEKCQGTKLVIHTDYNGLGKLQYLFGQQKLAILNTEYAADVVMTVLVPSGQKDMIYKSVVEQTNGSAGLEWKESVIYAVIDKEVVVF